MDRRLFLRRSIQGSLGWVGWTAVNQARVRQSLVPDPPVHSIVPVIGDGRWIWTEPPEETGYLEPREYELNVGIRMEGTGSARGLMSTTPVPVNFPEQTIQKLNVQSQGCSAAVRTLVPEAAQLVLAAPSLVRGQTILAFAHMQLKLFKQYLDFEKDQFPTEQPKPPISFRKQFSHNSPGIQTRAPQVRKLAMEVVGYRTHGWDKAHSIYEWVWENITSRIGSFTSVTRALRDRVGDCEERAACFVALCRAVGVPARLVWVPNHNWAEFFLVNSDQKGHWIPVHTAAYTWFGWTGAHELVIQKGDRIKVPEKSKPQRLLADWSQWQGAKPRVQYLAELRPLPSQSGGDAGPGARTKDQRGAWMLTGSHEKDAVLRDGQALHH